MTTRLVRLGDYCHQDRTSVRPGERPDLRYIGLETIESGSGQFQDGELSKTPEVPQANSFHFGPEHVLYGKLRPYLNKVALPEFEGKCSTEIIPLRPDAALDRRYLAYFLRSADTVAHISERTAGARMPRADMDFVLGLQLPLPSLDEQRRIIDLLSRAEGIVRLRREAQKKAAEIIPALFLDMFGDPATNPKGWPVVSLGDHVFIASVVRTPDLVKDTDHLCIGADSIESGSSRLISFPTVCEVLPKSGKYRFEPSDVLYSKIRPNLAKAALAHTDCYCSADMYPLRCRETVLPRFILALLLSTAFTEFATAESIRAQMPKLNRETLFGYGFPLPPIALQQRFGQITEQLQSVQRQQREATVASEGTFQSLLARAFTGDVTAIPLAANEAAVA